MIIGIEIQVKKNQITTLTKHYKQNDTHGYIISEEELDCTPAKKI